MWKADTLRRRCDPYLCRAKFFCLGRCTLIDPRPQKLSKTQRKWLKHFAAGKVNKSTAQDGNDGLASSTPSDGMPLLSGLQLPADSLESTPGLSQATCTSYATTAQSQGPTAEQDAAIAAGRSTTAGSERHAAALQGSRTMRPPLDKSAHELASEQALKHSDCPNAHEQTPAAEAGLSDRTTVGAAPSQLRAAESVSCDLPALDARSAVQPQQLDLRGSLSRQVQVNQTSHPHA